METKTKKRITKKIVSTPVAKNVTSETITKKFDFLTFLKNKKVLGAIGILIVVIILLAAMVKNVFLAAMVNGQPIFRHSVIASLEKQYGKATLDNLITEKLILQEADKRNISVSQNDIDSEFKKISANLSAQGTSLEQALAEQGMTKSDLNKEIILQISLNKMIEKSVTLTQKEVDDFVEANKSRMTPETTEAQFKEFAVQQLKQQKVQSKIQDLIKELQSKANIIHLLSY